MVTGQVILDLPGITTTSAVGYDGRNGIYPQQLQEEMINDANQQIAELASVFEKRCKDAGVAHEVASVQGVPSREILATALFHDLVVMGMRTFFHFETRKGPGDSLEKVLNHSVAPVLAVPESFGGKLERVLVAFDGSHHAASALHKFAALADPRRVKVTVLTADTKPDLAEDGLRNTVEYLRAHGFQNVKTVHSEMKPHDAIREHIADGIDLIVAGVHSKKPIRDLFVGSFTRSLIDDGSIPLFLGQ